jgi:ribonuclease HII
LGTSFSEDFKFFEKIASKNGFFNIAGIDEAGRGPLAGPVVSSAVILPYDFFHKEIKDSKKLSPKKREYLFDILYKEAVSIGIGIVWHKKIDEINILKASLLSMKKAVLNLEKKPDFLLIDGIYKIDSDIPQKTIPKGDSLSISIASGSIIAKVTRDRIMCDLHKLYPEYGFDRHKGYPTKQHKEIIKKIGPAPVHRFTFKGVMAS